MHFRISMLLALVCCCSPPIQTVSACQGVRGRESLRKPNVIIFFIDDLGFTDLSVYRQRVQNSPAYYETPNIDRLAKRSVMFTNFYSAHPVCSPTRAALMTGKAPQRMGITQWIRQPSDIHLPLGETTLGEAFAEAGYQTGYIGKWHLGEKDDQLPDAHGFQWMRSVNRAGQPGSYFHPFKSKRRGSPNYWDVPDLADSSQGDYLTDKITDQAISFIKANQENPFLLCLSHYAVHTPIQSPPELITKYKQKRQRMFSGTALDPIKHINNSNSRARQDDPAYAAMIENLDLNIARVLDEVDRLGLTEDTIILFSSDNGGLTTVPGKRGGPTSVRPLRAGKGWNYEGGIRVPTMIAWPGKIKPAVTSIPAITMDLYPTLLELAELDPKPEQHLDGISLVGALTNSPGKQLRNRFLAWHYPHNHGSGHTPSNAILKGGWKLIHRSGPTQAIELYDLANDVGESKNVAAMNPEKTRELMDLLAQWVKSTQGKMVRSTNN